MNPSREREMERRKETAMPDAAVMCLAKPNRDRQFSFFSPSTLPYLDFYSTLLLIPLRNNLPAPIMG